MREPYIPFETARALVSDFAEIGACKLTFIGGEPTLYGASQDQKPLLDLIRISKEIGYEYVRLDTGGQFKAALLSREAFKKLDELAFSLDGPSSTMNDSIRGKDTFNHCVRNIKKSLELGYNVSITSCVSRKLLERNSEGRLLMDTMIRFAESLDVSAINFHDLFKVGVPMDNWTGDFDPDPEQWVPAYHEIKTNCEKGEYGIHVRLPLCFVTEEEFRSNPGYYGYCPVKLGERVMVHPNGMIRICSNLICTAFGIARYHDERIEWDRTRANETLDHQLHQYTPCTNRSKFKSYGKYVPVCFSLKPDQEEIVWQKKLNWDARRNHATMERAVALSC
jgi:MoaA/NifB/PqqE/SkfB family radical SAM enzyme